MAYYWVTEAQKYIQSLGLAAHLRPINKESQDVRINQWGMDNSFSWDKHDLLRFGKGGVDDAEDAEVILHEYGHAIQDSQMTPLRVRRLGRSRRRSARASATTGRSLSAAGRAHARSGLRGRLGLGLLHLDSTALPAADRHGPALPRGFERPGPSRRHDLVAGPMGYPACARPRQGRYPDPGSKLLRGRHDDACRRAGDGPPLWFCTDRLWPTRCGLPLWTVGFWTEALVML